MNPQVAKIFVKVIVGIAGSALLGTVYKGEKAIQAKIDDHYTEPQNEEQPES